MLGISQANMTKQHQLTTDKNPYIMAGEEIGDQKETTLIAFLGELQGTKTGQHRSSAKLI